MSICLFFSSFLFSPRQLFGNFIWTQQSLLMESKRYLSKLLSLVQFSKSGNNSTLLCRCKKMFRSVYHKKHVINSQDRGLLEHKTQIFSYFMGTNHILIIIRVKQGWQDLSLCTPSSKENKDLNISA